MFDIFEVTYLQLKVGMGHCQAIVAQAIVAAFTGLRSIVVLHSVVSFHGLAFVPRAMKFVHLI